MVYKQEWYDEDMMLTVESACRVLPYVVERYKPKSVVDIGCGNGVWLQEMTNLGVTDIIGVDEPQQRLAIDPSLFTTADFTRRFPPFPRVFDLALCLEVGEHLPETLAESFVDYLATLSRTIIFSAAIPGQAGHLHINCQWQGYWIEKFRRRSYRASAWLREEIWNDSRIAYFYRQNIVVFEYVPLSPHAIVHDVVHPEFYLYKLQSLGAKGWGL
jgi:SAM-dependent methyltransferase